MTQTMVRINSYAPRCIDGRKAIMIIEWNGKHWVVAKRYGAANNESGPQFLGAALMFIRLLQEVVGASLEEAFAMTEDAFRVVEWTPQFHIDDHHSELDFLNMTDEEVLDIVLNEYVMGCGFAQYAWGEEAETVLRMAIGHHWRIQILGGEHGEAGASKNHIPHTTFKPTTFPVCGPTRFNIDLAMARVIVILLNSLNDFGRDIVAESMLWVNNRFDEVVVLLKGVTQPSEIEVLGSPVHA